MEPNSILCRCGEITIRLRDVIQLRIKEENGFVFISNEPLSICGTGMTRDEAMADFSRQLLHFYKYYRDIPETKLIGKERILKGLYANLFWD